jgi:diguanylate cyclase (GGDEF)-like protein
LASGSFLAWNSGADRDEFVDSTSVMGAQSAATSLTDRLSDIGNAVLLLAGDGDVRSLMAATDAGADSVAVDDAGRRLLALTELQGSPVSSASLLDANAVERVRVVGRSVAGPEELGADLSEAPFLMGVGSLVPMTTAWTEPFFSSHTGEPVVAVIVELPGIDEGRPSGYLKVEADLVDMYSAVAGRSSVRLVIGNQIVEIDASGDRSDLTPAAEALLEDLDTAATSSSKLSKYALMQVDVDLVSGGKWFALVPTPPSSTDWSTLLALLVLIGGTALLVATANGREAKPGLVPSADQLNERDSSWTVDSTALEHHALRAVSTARRHQRQTALLVIDVECLEDGIVGEADVSETDLARDLLQRLEQAVRLGDTVSYVGGHRFGVTLDETDGVVGALEAVERLESAVFSQLWMFGDRAMTLQASIGLALYPNDSSDADELIGHAEIAADHAKANGLAHCLYNRDLDPNRPERLALASDLQFAINLGELDLHYQPKWSLATGAIVGVEAFVRWNHPVRGPLAPVDFLDVAESAGLLAELNRKVMSVAASQHHRWRSDGRDIEVGINISPTSFRDAGFLGDIVRMLDRLDGPPTGLVIEVTEATLLTRPDHAVDVLHTLRELGLSIAVTDFGTGFSSLRYLRKLPVTELKIDRGFIKRLADHPVDQAIVRSAIGLGQSLGCLVTAEGVEDARTLTMLRQMGCDQAQGYLLGRPVPADQLAQLLATRKSDRRESDREKPGELRPEVLARLEALRRQIDNPPPVAE